MLSFFQLDVLGEIWDLIESVFEDFPTYSSITHLGSISVLRMAFYKGRFDCMATDAHPGYASRTVAQTSSHKCVTNHRKYGDI